jgi:iron(III) transport system substrate-binding protein
MKKVLFLMLIVLTVLSFPGFADKALVYISGPEAMVKRIEQAFEKENGDCLEVYHTGSGPLKQKVFTELMIGNIQADIIWGSEPIMYYQLLENDVFEQYYPQDYDLLKEAYKYGKGYFTASNARYGALVYNSTLLSEEELPKFWGDLKSDFWKNKIAMADASQSAMAFSLIANLYYLTDGEQLLESIGKNNVFLTKMNIDAISKVQGGEKSLCIAATDGAIRIINSMKKKGITSNLRILNPADGVFSIQRPIAIVKKNRNDEETEILHKFVDFSISIECQKISTSFGFSNVRKTENNQKNESAKVIYPDWETIKDNQELILESFTEHILD